MLMPMLMLMLMLMLSSRSSFNVLLARTLTDYTLIRVKSLDSLENTKEDPETEHVAVREADHKSLALSFMLTQLVLQQAQSPPLCIAQAQKGDRGHSVTSTENRGCIRKTCSHRWTCRSTSHARNSPTPSRTTLMWSRSHYTKWYSGVILQRDGYYYRQVQKKHTRFAHQTGSPLVSEFGIITNIELKTGQGMCCCKLRCH